MAHQGAPQSLGIRDPLDDGVSMRLVNWYPHPADNRYQVFEFRSRELAKEFARDLEREGIEAERGERQEEGDTVALFGVHRDQFKAALRVNHLLHGRHRRPFIAHRGLRWAMLLITALAVGLGVMGWMKS